MNSQAERLRSIISLYNSTMATFEKNCGLSNGAISLRIREGRNFSPNTISKICNYYPINEYWLYCGQGEVFKEELTLIEHFVKLLFDLGIDFFSFEAEYGLLPGTLKGIFDGKEERSNYDIVSWVRFLQKYDPKLDYSWVDEYDEELPHFEDLSYPEDAIEEKIKENRKTGHPQSEENIKNAPVLERLSNNADFEAEVIDDSLAPNTTYGDVAICKYSDLSEEIKWNDVYYIETNKISMLRKIKPDENPDNIKCVARNEEYDTIILSKREIVKAGIVIGIIKKRA